MLDKQLMGRTIVSKLVTSYKRQIHICLFCYVLCPPSATKNSLFREWRSANVSKAKIKTALGLSAVIFLLGLVLDKTDHKVACKDDKHKCDRIC